MIHGPTSPDDPRLAPYRRVADHAWLSGQGLFVAEGRLVLQRLLALDRHEIVSVLVNRAAGQALARELEAVTADVFVSDDPTLERVAGFNFHRGCLALVRRPAPLRVERLLEGATVLALEAVSNPDNVGGLFRTAAAFGVDGVLLSPTAGDPLYRKSIRTSMGASLRIPFARAAAWPADLGRFGARGAQVVALTPAAAATPLTDFAAGLPSGARIVLLVGAEGPGLRPETLALADALVRVPIDGRIDSLNVVVAAGIALHAVAARRGGSGVV
jgi:tRNA G18 (ribose-2'-O)-methylase SpoU